MKRRKISCSETRSEPYQRRVLLFDATRPIVLHPPPPREPRRRLPFALTSKGGSIMQEAGVSFLTTWHSFYAIIGSAAATLTGLMFVVLTLSSGARVRGSSGTIGAFSSP